LSKVEVFEVICGPFEFVVFGCMGVSGLLGPTG
jgi:hypothetical protein